MRDLAQLRSFAAVQLAAGINAVGQQDPVATVTGAVEKDENRGGLATRFVSRVLDIHTQTASMTAIIPGPRDIDCL